MQNKIKAYCIIEKDDKLLLSKDIDATGWSLPGGGIKNGELVKDAAVREMSEETGYFVELTGIVSVQEYVIDDIRHVLRFYFTARIISGKENKQKDEIGELKWVSKGKVKELKEQDFALKPHYLALQDYLTGPIQSIRLFKSLTK